MPFINSKISVALTDAQEQEIKSRLGQAITAIPGKSESWLMVGFEPEYKLYFRGSKDQPRCNKCVRKRESVRVLQADWRDLQDI